MGELSIKVTIGNRVYPLTIQRDEEEGIRKAAKLVNENMKNLEQNYAVKDRQDLLAMTALEYATQSLSGSAVVDDEVLEKLEDLENRLDTFLSKS